MTTEPTAFDYIVIGAGSAGCVVAGRLSEAGHSVLLLEAGGPDRSPWIHIPMGYAKLYANPAINWCFSSGPEPELNGRRLFQPRGKVLGGTGSINGMIYVRGQPEDYDNWQALGCEGWGFDDVMPFFKKCEHQERGANAHHATGGPVWVSDLPSRHELADAFIDSAIRLGSPRNDDFNGETQLGAGYVQVTTRKGRRWSTAAGYLGKRQNLEVVTNALVKRILLDNGRAVGVRYGVGGAEQEARAHAEVILCGGAYSSPPLLQISGIGPGDVLNDIGVPVQVELPGVGENLQDHFGVGLEFRSRTPATVNDLHNNKLRGGLALLRYLLFRTGPMASNGNFANTFVHTSPEIDRPDMMITFMAWCTDENLQPRPFSGFTILAEHIRPEARGTVRATGQDAADQPAIQFNFLKSEADRNAAIAGLKHAREISMTDPMRSHVEAEINPGPDCKSDDDLLEHCRRSGLSLLHPVGSCKMGVDELAVVDARLRVRGVDRLRVVDASIMPTIVSGNTNAATIMIGEKGADMIMADAKAGLG